MGENLLEEMGRPLARGSGFFAEVTVIKKGTMLSRKKAGDGAVLSHTHEGERCVVHVCEQGFV